jgi:6-phosphogluconolactonase/glucosamine-6-phosphate isomerase/deaminase
MSYRLLQAATEVWVLASGTGKATALSQSLLSDRTPLGQVRTQRASLRIFSDIGID